LVGIEPASMAAVSCENTADRKAETWENHLAAFDRVEFIVSDAAKGIAKAVQQVAAARRDDPQAPTLEHGLDVFHTTMEARRILAQEWRRVEAAWEKGEAADAKVAGSKRQGIDARSVSEAARAALTQAVGAFERFEDHEAAWERAHAALDLFDADCRLNDRSRAEREIAEALKGLSDPEWSKVRNFLNDPRSLSFLDRMHRRLEEAEPHPERREAMAWRWWLRHHRPRSSDRLTNLVRAVGRDGVLHESDQISYDRVSAVLKDTFRASSAVECMNSVLRMQQSRHRRMTQPMLDLKRLYWNCHPFRSGRRKDVCPYQKLGLELPTFDFWDLLRTDPPNLTQRLSTSENAK
jgi:hypothetical protein